jgi:hypothetical protein
MEAQEQRQIILVPRSLTQAVAVAGHLLAQAALEALEAVELAQQTIAEILLELLTQAAVEAVEAMARQAVQE